MNVWPLLLFALLTVSQKASYFGFGVFVTIAQICVPIFLSSFLNVYLAHCKTWVNHEVFFLCTFHIPFDSSTTFYVSYFNGEILPWVVDWKLHSDGIRLHRLYFVIVVYY